MKSANTQLVRCISGDGMMGPGVSFFEVSEIDEARGESGKLYREFLRLPPMSAGLYVLAAGSMDPQKPHSEDELYYVVRGRARFQAYETANEKHQEVMAGSVIFVPAQVPHAFYDISEELTVLVFFAPAES